MKFHVIIFFSILNISAGFTQTQSHPNSLFLSNDFLSFTETVDSGEDKLLAWDFSFTGTSKSKSGEVTYYDYRLDHSLNQNTEKYHFDIFSITNDLKRFEYNTSSNKNFLGYKKKLIKAGFIKVSENFYSKKIRNKTYYMKLDRSVHSSGTPNYRIHIDYSS